MSSSDLVDLTYLRTFVAVVQEGLLTRAAERLHISQPTASGHVRALESQLGVQLFHRGARGLEPTPAGVRLAQAASRVLGTSLELTSLAGELRGAPFSRLSLATPADPKVIARFPAVMIRLRAEHPQVELNMEVRNSLATKQGIRAGEIDAGVFVDFGLEEDLDGFSLRSLEYVIAAPYAWKERVGDADWRDLAAMPWIVTHKGTSTADLIEQLLRPRGLEPNVALTVNHDALLREMIGGGVGIGLVRRETAAPMEASRRLTFAPQTVCYSKMLFGYLRARRAEPVIEAVVRAVRETGLDAGTPTSG